MFLSLIFQKQLLFLRNRLISSLESFEIKVGPDKIKTKTYLKITDTFLRNRLDLDCKDYDNRFALLKKYRDECLSNAKNKEVSFILGNDMVEENLKKAEILINDLDKPTKLYLINFNKQLTITEAKKEIKRLGFSFPNLLETILFIQEYENEIIQLPIISLDAHLRSKLDKNSIIYDGFNCVHFVVTKNQSYNYDIKNIGTTELEEKLGFVFAKNAHFLVKPL